MNRFFKFVVVLYTTKLFSFIPVSMTITFFEGHLFTRDLEIVQSFYSLYHEVIQTFITVDCVG